MLPELNTEDSIDTLEVSEAKIVRGYIVKVPDINTTVDEEKSMAAPISLSQPVKDWISSRKENIRPLTTFCNSANYQVPFIIKTPTQPQLKLA